MEFWYKLGWALINNIYLDTNTNYQHSKRKARETNAHNLKNNPPYANKFISEKWNKSENASTNNIYVGVLDVKTSANLLYL